MINVATGGTHLAESAARDDEPRSSGTNIEPIYADRAAGDVKDSQADISKAQRLLGYTPVVARGGLRHTLEWCRSRTAAAAGR